MAEYQSLADFLGVQDPLAPDRPVETDGPPEDISAKDFALGILNSRQYRESLMRRIVMDELPPAVEVLLHHQAHGKPKETLEHTGKNGGPIEVSRRIIDPAPEGGMRKDAAA